MGSIDRQVQRAGAAKQAKDTRAKVSATAKKKARELDAPAGNDEPLAPEVQARLAAIVAEIVAVHRKSTAQVFDVGGWMAEAKSLQPQKGYGRWLKENCGYTVRSAWSFISVHERLGDYRARLEKHAFTTTPLFELAKGEPDQISAVLDQFDEGKHLTGAEIKTIVSGNETKAEDADPTQIGGKLGLQKMAAAKLKSDMVEFHRLTALVLVELEDAVARVDAGKRIVMRSLANEVEIDARHASDLFKDIAAPLRASEFNQRGNLSHADIGRQTGWGAVQHSLFRLGGAGSWPARDEMEKWVVEVAHPALRFAVHGDPFVPNTKPADDHGTAVAGADGDVKENDASVLDREEEIDTAPPSVSEAEMDAALNSLMAGTSGSVSPSMSR
ncbi:MAG: hypothetical protein VR78_08800 [Hoeflea sp. BRH_c9]|nr:MAG: hypothetical protein VR78_08800 [Hoeflea sp. BRH_c9]